MATFTRFDHYVFCERCQCAAGDWAIEFRADRNAYVYWAKCHGEYESGEIPSSILTYSPQDLCPFVAFKGGMKDVTPELLVIDHECDRNPRPAFLKLSSQVQREYEDSLEAENSTPQPRGPVFRSRRILPRE